MKLHMKTAICDTFKYLYEPVDDVCCICVYNGTSRIHCEFGYEPEFDRNLLMYFINTMHNQFDKILGNNSVFTIDNGDDLISIKPTPFDDFGITVSDITCLLDMDCV